MSIRSRKRRSGMAIWMMILAWLNGRPEEAVLVTVFLPITQLLVLFHQLAWILWMYRRVLALPLGNERTEMARVNQKCTLYQLARSQTRWLNPKSWLLIR